MTTTTDAATRREWLGLAVLAHLSADLHAGSTQQLWILDSYGFLLAGSSVIWFAPLRRYPPSSLLRARRWRACARAPVQTADALSLSLTRHDGHARRPDRQAQAADDRRRPVHRAGDRGDRDRAPDR